jgi:hypothetical protein
MTLVRMAVGMIVVVVMVIVAAIRSVHMRRGADVLVVAVMMMRVAVMGMIVRFMPVIGMVVGVIVSMDRRGGDIGAAFGIERRFDRDDAGAEAARHILDDVIAPDAQAFLQQFGRQMAIAEMPGDPHQGGGVGAANFSQGLGRSDDFDDPPVLQRQAIAGPQHHRLRQIEQEGQTPNPGHRHAPAIAIVVIENDRIRRFSGPGASGTNGMSVLHELPGFQEATSRAAVGFSHTRLARFRKASTPGGALEACD